MCYGLFVYNVYALCHLNGNGVGGRARTPRGEWKRPKGKSNKTPYSFIMYEWRLLRRTFGIAANAMLFYTCHNGRQRSAIFRTQCARYYSEDNLTSTHVRTGRLRAVRGLWATLHTGKIRIPRNPFCLFDVYVVVPHASYVTFHICVISGLRWYYVTRHNKRINKRSRLETSSV